VPAGLGEAGVWHRWRRHGMAAGGQAGSGDEWAGGGGKRVEGQGQTTRCAAAEQIFKSYHGRDTGLSLRGGGQ
jgi:hypothetical protein